MSKKILTEELIQERLEIENITEPREVSHDDRLLLLENIYNFSIVKDWDKCDAYFYTDTTADGYEVWIATEQEGNVAVNEDLYYYESDWFEKLADYLRGGCIVYIDTYSQQDVGFEEVIEALYEEWYIDKYEAMEEQLKDEGYSYLES